MFRFRGIRRRAEAGDREAVARFPQMYRKMYQAMDDLRETRKSRPDASTHKERRESITEHVKKVVALVFGSSNMQHVYHSRPEWKHIEMRDTGGDEWKEKDGSVRFQLLAMRDRQITLENEMRKLVRVYKELERNA
jgi:hypothetical protein